MSSRPANIEPENNRAWAGVHWLNQEIRTESILRPTAGAIRLWHPCVDVYVSNPQATVVARSDRNGAGRKLGRAVAEIHARAGGASADRVRGRAPWRSCPNRAGTP